MNPRKGIRCSGTLSRGRALRDAVLALRRLGACRLMGLKENQPRVVLGEATGVSSRERR